MKTKKQKSIFTLPSMAGTGRKYAPFTMTIRGGHLMLDLPSPYKVKGIKKANVNPQLWKHVLSSPVEGQFRVKDGNEDYLREGFIHIQVALPFEVNRSYGYADNFPLK